MLKIQIIGADCPDCARVYDRVQEVVADLGLEASLEKVENLVDIVRLGVMQSPAILVDGKTLSAGSVPSLKKIQSLLLPYQEKEK